MADCDGERLSIHPLFETLDEQPEAVITDVEGEVPDWIEGCLVRVGPGKFEFGDDCVKHWFDGHGILHRFNIRDGGVTFQSKFVETSAYKSNMAAQRITVAEFGTAATPDPCASKFARFKSHFFNPQRSDNVNTNIFKFGDALIVNTDSPCQQIVDTDLSRTEPHNMVDVLAISLISSHPHFDDEGNMFTAGSSFNGRPQHHIIKIPAPTNKESDTKKLLDRAKIIASIPSRYAFSPSYCHSFGMTDNYFIYCETPVTMNMFKSLGAVIRGQPMNDVFSYDSNDTAMFHLIKRSSGDVTRIKYHVKGLFFWHIINCYEQDQHLVIDLCTLSGFKNTDLFTEPLEEFRNGVFIEEKKWSVYDHHPARLVLPLKNPVNASPTTNLVTLPGTKCEAYIADKNNYNLVPERLLPPGQDRIDMPQINYEKINGKKYRYFYGTGLFINQYFMNGLGKVDVEDKSCIRWKGSIDQYPSEPVFVPHPNGRAEDDGIVMASVCDTNPKNRDFLLILDGKTFKEIARAYVPQHLRVPYTFHGSFYNT